MHAQLLSHVRIVLYSGVLLSVSYTLPQKNNKYFWMLIKSTIYHWYTKKLFCLCCLNFYMSLNQSHEVSNDVILRKLEILSSIPSCAVPLTLWVNLDTSFTDLILSFLISVLGIKTVPTLQDLVEIKWDDGCKLPGLWQTFSTLTVTAVTFPWSYFIGEKAWDQQQLPKSTRLILICDRARTQICVSVTIE